MKDFIKNFLIIFCCLLLVAGVLSFVKGGSKQTVEKISIGKLVEEINAGAVQKITVMGDNLSIALKNDNTKTQEVQKEANQSFGDILKNYGVNDSAKAGLDVEVKDENSAKFWATVLLPTILPLIIIMGFLFFMTRGVQGMNNKAMGFGQSNPKQSDATSKNKKSFAEVAGAKEAKEELMEIVEFLKTPKKSLPTPALPQRLLPGSYRRPTPLSGILCSRFFL